MATRAMAPRQTPQLRFRAEEIWYGIKSGKVNLVVEWLAGGGQVDKKMSDPERPRYESTPLLLACSEGRAEGVVDLLLEHDANVNLQLESNGPSHGLTPLIVAAVAGNPRIVRRLLSAGAKIGTRTPEGKTARMLAEHLKQHECVRAIREHLEATVKAASSAPSAVSRRTAMNEERKGQQQEQEDLERATAASLAISSGTGIFSGTAPPPPPKPIDSSEVDLVCARGADEGSVRGQPMPVVLNAAISEGSVAGVAAWLDGGGQVDHGWASRDAFDETHNITTLMGACTCGHVSVIDLLLERGASVDLQDSYGDTALMWAVSQGDAAIVHRLLRAGARTDLRADEGHTVIEMAMECGKYVCVRILREHEAKAQAAADGADKLPPMTVLSALDLKREELASGETLPTQLLDALLDGEVRTVAAWLDSGVHVNRGWTTPVPTGRRHPPHHSHATGVTMLLLACVHGQMGVIDLLLERGADTDLQDNVGGYPLFNATLHGQAAVVRRLLRAGARADLRTGNGGGFTGCSVTSWAEANAQHECARIVLEHLGLPVPVAEKPVLPSNSNPSVRDRLQARLAARAGAATTSSEPNLEAGPSVEGAALVEPAAAAARAAEELLHDGMRDNDGASSSTKGKSKKKKKGKAKHAEAGAADTDPTMTLTASPAAAAPAMTPHPLPQAVETMTPHPSTAGDLTLPDMISNFVGLSNMLRVPRVQQAMQNKEPVFMKQLGDMLQAPEVREAIQNGLIPVDMIPAEIMEQFGIFPEMIIESVALAAVRGKMLNVKDVAEEEGATTESAGEGSACAQTSIPVHLSNALSGRDVAEIAAWLDGGGEVDCGWADKQVHDVTMLMHACQTADHLPCVDLLLERGANVNLRDSPDGCTALMRAASRGHATVVRRLLRAGAQLDLSTPSGLTALKMAKKQGHHECVSILREHVASKAARADEGAASGSAQGGKMGWSTIPPPLARGLQKSDVAEMGAWLNDHVNGGGKVDCGWAENGVHDMTTLMCACQTGCLPFVDLLLERGASVNLLDSDGCTALMHAAGFGHAAIVRRLLRAGAQINVRDYDGTTALTAAEESGHHDCVRILRDSGAQREGIVVYQHTPQSTSNARDRLQARLASRASASTGSSEHKSEAGASGDDEALAERAAAAARAAEELLQEEERDKEGAASSTKGKSKKKKKGKAKHVVAGAAETEEGVAEVVATEAADTQAKASGPAATEAAGAGEGSSKDFSKCVVCFEGALTHIFVPCGHQCVCAGCAASVMERSGKCPICCELAMTTMKVWVQGAN